MVGTFFEINILSIVKYQYYNHVFDILSRAYILRSVTPVINLPYLFSCSWNGISPHKELRNNFQNWDLPILPTVVFSWTIITIQASIKIIQRTGFDSIDVFFAQIGAQFVQNTREKIGIISQPFCKYHRNKYYR